MTVITVLMTVTFASLFFFDVAFSGTVLRDSSNQYKYGKVLCDVVMGDF